MRTMVRGIVYEKEMETLPCFWNLCPSGGHGWVEINGKVYDPDWALVSKVDSYFGMSYDLSGVNGRPNYKANRYYTVKI
ncbi:MAG: hypothetical protein SOZ59_02695 [Candidatus Limivivens sp.]|nr:hypothetical protein [Candidatus Limivivens sp.]